MGNFSDFIKNENNTYKNNNESNMKNNNIDENANKIKLEEMINNYKGLSQSELMNEFIKMTMKKKKDGTLKESELENIKKTILPYLTEEQKTNLENILNMVRNV
ncbi:MAG: hypothetical protein E7345_01040 [Clostridiales bacterium]|nr:hypothetical protein [Clostridiales bacterium]